MGRQIGHFLSETDGERLVEHLRLKFPILVVDSVYPWSWDKRTLTRTPDAVKWIIADERAVPILIEEALRFSAAHRGSNGWQILSSAYSCIEWSPGRRGRFYLNTTPDPIWTDISAATGDDVERTYERACRYIKANCVNVGTTQRAFWVSKELVPTYRKMQEATEARARAQPKDPRDRAFYELRRKPEKRLTADDKATLIRYCDAMIAYLGDSTATPGWIEYRSALIRGGSRR
jgi:hypothetical protein